MVGVTTALSGVVVSIISLWIYHNRQVKKKKKAEELDTQLSDCFIILHWAYGDPVTSLFLVVKKVQEELCWTAVSELQSLP